MAVILPIQLEITVDNFEAHFNKKLLILLRFFKIITEISNGIHRLAIAKEFMCYNEVRSL